MVIAHALYHNLIEIICIWNFITLTMCRRIGTTIQVTFISLDVILECIIIHLYPTYIRYVNYRNIYNKLKHTANKTYYANLRNTFKNDAKKTWQLLRTVIGKHNGTSCIPTCFKYNNDLTHDPDKISNKF